MPTPSMRTKLSGPFFRPSHTAFAHLSSSPGQRTAEYIANIGGFEQFDALNQWQAGVTIHVRHHLFQLLVSNSTLTTPDFMAAGSFKTGIKSNVRFGFNLVRTFSF